VTSYQYDVANRITDVNGVNYTWDNNGNLLNDGVNTYTYDSANRLTAITGGQTATYAYNGLGDRLIQNGVNYTLDLNAGLTQVLNDGTNQYLYGLGRISQVNTTTEYFLGDALGSVRQLTNGQGEITLANAYEPYGVLAQSTGSAQTSYGFTGEFTDPSGMVYLRARYYMPGDGRFITRDTWMGDYNSPLSLNRWNYTFSNPINYSDPSGYCTGYKGIDPFIDTAMSFTALYLLDADHWRATGDSWKTAWNTCVESFQKASAEYQKGNYWRAYLYANGFVASSHQAAARIEQINRELDTIWCEDASLGDRIVAALDVGAWSIGIASFIAPFAHEGWLATKGAINNTYLSGLSIGVPDEFLPPFVTGQWMNWSDDEIARWVVRTNAINPSNSLINCVNCAFALDQTFGGKFTVALNSRLKLESQMVREYSNYYGSTATQAFMRQQVNPSIIIANLNQVGNGGRGIVVAFPRYGDGHVFNVINVYGEILAVDSQMKLLMPLERYVTQSNFVEFYFLLTAR